MSKYEDVCRLACIYVSLDSKWGSLDRILRIWTVFLSKWTVIRSFWIVSYRFVLNSLLERIIMDVMLSSFLFNICYNYTIVRIPLRRAFL